MNENEIPRRMTYIPRLGHGDMADTEHEYYSEKAMQSLRELQTLIQKVIDPLSAVGPDTHSVTLLAAAVATAAEHQVSPHLMQMLAEGVNPMQAAQAGQDKIHELLFINGYVAGMYRMTLDTLFNTPHGDE